MSGYKIDTTKLWLPITVENCARNWAQAYNASNIRQQNFSSPINLSGQIINYHLSSHPRVYFMMSHDNASSYSNASSFNYASWKFNDTAINYRVRNYNMLYLPRTVGADNCYAFLDGHELSNTYPVASNTITWGSVNYPQDLAQTTIRYERGNYSNNVASDTITFSGGFNLADLVVQDECVSAFENGVHDFIPMDAIRPGDEITTIVPEKIRAYIHNLENNRSSYIGWCAANYDQDLRPAASGATGILVETTDVANIMDGASTTRTETTGGIHCPGYRCGRGLETHASGKLVKLVCHVLAVSPDCNGTIKLIGPDHIASNEITITVTEGGTPTWYDDVLYLNPNAAWDDVTTGRNKIDILAGIVDPGDKMWIYTICCWPEYY